MNHSRKKIKTHICILIFILINFLFLVKYISRITSQYVVVSLLISLCYYLFWQFRFKFKKIFENTKFLNIILLIIFIVITTLIFKKIPVESLNVDRWSVITSFWNNYFKGEYVYFAKSNVGNPPGPMPFYFILAFPFYLIGELGYFSILGIVVFLLLTKYDSKPIYLQSTYLIMIMTSTFFLWEVVCRSNIFLNGTLIVFSMVFFFKSLENIKTNYILKNGIIIGLLLSTRNVFVIPYIVCFLFALKFKYLSIKSTIQIGIIVLTIFILTFIPFIYNHINDFNKMNPFMIQSGFLMPIEYSLISIGLSFGTIYFKKKKNDVFFYSGLILFLTIIFHFVHHITIYNFKETFFNSKADISYFILCIPFILYYMIENENVN